MNLEKLKHTLRARAGYEIVHENIRGNVVEWEGRVPSNSRASWFSVRDSMLNFSLRHGFSSSLFFGQRYFKKVADGPTVYSWMVVISGKDEAALEKNLGALLQAVQTAPRVVAVINEFPLPGVSGDRNVGGRASSNGLSRGASTIGGKTGAGSFYRTNR